MASEPERALRAKAARRTVLGACPPLAETWAFGGALRWAGPRTPATLQLRSWNLPSRRTRRGWPAPPGRTLAPVGGREGADTRPGRRMLPSGWAAAARAGGGRVSGCGWQPRRKRPPTHPGRCPPRPAPANSKAQPADPALWPPPSPEATHHFPSGRQHPLAFPRAPLRMAPWPPPFLPPR